MRPKIADSLCDKCYTAVEHVAEGNDDWELWVMLMAVFACEKCAAKIEAATRQALEAQEWDLSEPVPEDWKE
jgi:predicted metal-binding protein